MAQPPPIPGLPPAAPEPPVSGPVASISGATPAATLEKATEAGGWETAAATINLGGPATGGTLLELEFLMTDLGMVNGDPLELAIVAVESGEAIDVAPNLGTHIVFADPGNEAARRELAAAGSGR